MSTLHESPSLMMLSSYLMLLLFFLLLHPHSCKSVDLKSCGFQAMYNFGDSLSDTGNSMAAKPDPHAWLYPLGMTIGKQTGRACDGLLIIDRITEASGLPFCNPYLNKSLDHSKGTNFAVGGTGLLSKEERAKWNIAFKYNNDSLDVQLRWFDQHLNDNFKDEKARREHLKSSLIMIGGGGNDYGAMGGAPFYDNLPYLEQKKLIMPFIIGALVDAVKKFVSYGATKVIATGVYQGGCIGNYKVHDKSLSCWEPSNEFHRLHNQYLQQELEKLRKEYPNARFAYGDVWRGAQWVWDNYPSLGIVYPQKACCGSEKFPNCGHEGCPYCKNPKEYVFWDGVGHFTDIAYKYMAQQMIPQIAAELQCSDTKTEL